MRIYKRSPTSLFYTVDFELDGEELRRSSGLTNFKYAKNSGNALRTRMIQEKAGLIPREKPKPSTFSEFKDTFNEWVRSDRPKSFLFYPVSCCEDVERRVTYVFTSEDNEFGVSAAEEPLRSCSTLARYCAICRGEMLALEKTAW